MRKRKLRIVILIIVIVVLLSLTGVFALKKARSMYLYTLNLISDTSEQQTLDLTRKLDLAYNFDYSWAEDNVLIAHAFGGMDNVDYTNSREAFEYNYEKGYRVFEVDFDLTEEELALVCTHDNNIYRENVNDEGEKIPYSLDVFKNTLIMGKYHSLTGEDIIDLLAMYPDIYIVTDTKQGDRTNTLLMFSQLVKYATDKDCIEVLDRIIPQVYNEEVFWAVMDVYEWKSVIYTLYATVWTEESVVEFCERTGVGYITFWNTSATEEIVDLWKANGLKIAVHTENNLSEARRYLDMGIDMIYTDFLDPQDFN